VIPAPESPPQGQDTLRRLDRQRRRASRRHLWGRLPTGRGRRLQPTDRLRPCPEGPGRRRGRACRRADSHRTDPGERIPPTGECAALRLAGSDHRVPSGQAIRVHRHGHGDGPEPQPGPRPTGDPHGHAGPPRTLHDPTLDQGGRTEGDACPQASRPTVPDVGPGWLPRSRSSSGAAPCWSASSRPV
jgi:hypothetical protein